MRMIRLTGFDDESIRVAVDAVVSVTSVRRTGATVVSLKNGEIHEVLQDPGMVAAMIEKADRASEGPVELSGCVRCVSMPVGARGRRRSATGARSGIC